MNDTKKIAVILPCYKVKNHVGELLSFLLETPYYIYCIDDKCPENSGEFIQSEFSHDRLKVVFHSENKGVGGAVKTGIKTAFEDDCDVFVKLDGDGQMDPKLIESLILPLLHDSADFVKGNRFHTIDGVKSMPALRLIGNSALSLLNKFISGYYGIMDPTNGFLALNRISVSMLPMERLDNRYFFESDLLFRLGTIRAVVSDFPMAASYGEEESNLRIRRVLVEFPPKYLNRFLKRIFYNYLLRDFSIGSLQLLTGSLLFLFGVIFGVYQWIVHDQLQTVTPTGTVMIAVLPIILGFQLLLSFLNYDIANMPSKPLCKLYPNNKK